MEDRAPGYYRQLFSDVLVEKEAVLWAAKPHRWAFILPPAGLFFFGLLWAAFDGFFIYLIASKGQMMKGPVPGFFFGFFALHGIPVWILLGWPIYRYLAWKNTAYAITDKRFLIRGGVIGVDYKSVEFEQVQGVDVTVNLAGKLFATGDVQLVQAGGGASNTVVLGRRQGNGAAFWAVEDPYKVAKLAKQVSLDVKTDVNYPNALRPAENPGYQTEYKGPGAGGAA